MATAEATQKIRSLQLLTCDVRMSYGRVSLTYMGNGRSTVSRVLFQRRELTEFCGKLGEFCGKLGEFCKTRWVRFGTETIGWEELTEFSPRNSVRAKKLTKFGVWNRALRNRVRPVSEYNLSLILFCTKPHWKDPTVLKIPRDSDLLHHSVFTPAPAFTTVQKPFFEGRAYDFRDNDVRCPHKRFAIVNHCAIALNLLRDSMFTIA